MQKMADVSTLEHDVEKPVFQNSINHDTILNCNLLDIINVSGELEVILEGNEENSNVINKDTPKINLTMVSAIDKTAKNDLQIFFFFSIWVFYHDHSRITHRTAGEGGGHFFNSSLPLPPASQTLRH